MAQAERIEWLVSEGARMAADQIIDDQKADELLAEALEGAEWLLSTNDDADGAL